MLRSLSLALLIAPLAASAQPGLLLFPAVGNPDEVVVQGRVLKERPSEGTSILSRNLRRLTASTWEGAPVEISFNGVTVKTRSGDDGIFEATFKFDASNRVPPGMYSWRARAPGAARVSTVRVVSDDAPFFVVSDFDDTVAVTNVRSKRGLLKSALLQDGDTLPAVPGMDAFYRCLVEARSPTPALAFVSGSPHQYAPRVVKFLLKNEFPFAGLYLRNFGPDTMKDYKQPVIRKLFGAVKQRAILIGDSGEHDPEIYAQMRREFPDRVLEIYIHDVGRTEDPKRHEGMILFEEGRDAAEHAVGKGYITKSCFDREFALEAQQ